MIKKVLGYTIVVVLLVLAYICVFRGASIGKFNIYSFEQMALEQKEYQSKIDNYNSLVNESYQSTISKLDTAKATFEINKNSYEELKMYSSYEELLELTRDKQYNLEFLWVKLDLIARNNDLNANFVLTNSYTGASKNLDVTLTGNYLAVKNYIYDILIDLELQFKAENITIEASGENVIARFTIKDIKVIM